MRNIVFYALVSIFISLGSAQALDMAMPQKTHHVIGGNGVRIAVQEWGNPKGRPIVFAHAWSQSHYGWLPQFRSDLTKEFHLITFDSRGHGNSEKPLITDHYNNGALWAEDLKAVITSLNLKDVTLVGWSYGSIIIADYLQKYGSDNIHALNIVGGLTGLGVKRVEKHFGNATAGSILAMQSDLPAQAEGMVHIARMMWPEDLDKELYGFMIATNMMASPLVRKAMVQRSADYKDLYMSLDIPVLFSHGDKDDGVLLIAAEEGSAMAPKGKLSVYKNAKHAPHWSDTKRFNQELSDLARK